MPPHHHHHGGGGHHHRGGARRRRGFGTVLLDDVPDYVSSACYRERLDDGSIAWRCPPDEAGDLFPTIVTPDDARRAIDETDAGYDRLNAAILASSNAPPEFKASWGLQFANFKTFAAGARATVGFLNTKAVMDQNDRYQEQLMSWSKSFALIGGSAPGPAPAAPGQGVPDTQAASLLSGTTGLIVAGAALAAVLIFGPRFSK